MKPLRRLAALALACLALTSCATTGDAPRGYFYRVPPGQTFDFATARVIGPEAQAERLADVRLLFLGEQHAHLLSHSAQLEVLRLLKSQGRAITVALEMLPDSTNEALEAWRLGSLDEAEFLERSNWYDNWGHPWRAYRELFLWLRENRIPTRGVNVDHTARAAVRKGDLSTLPEALRKEAGDLDAILEPHRDYLLDTLRETGHAGEIRLDSPTFRSMLRVQTLWDRIMGGRAAKLALSQPPEGIVVALIGSGHLVWRLGANLRAAQAGLLRQLSLWDSTVARSQLDLAGRAPVSVGISDWARIYVAEDAPRGFPALRGFELRPEAGGVAVASRSPFSPPYTRSIQAGDVIVSVMGRAVRSAAGLRMEFEALAWDAPAEVAIVRAGQPLTLTLRPARH